MQSSPRIPHFLRVFLILFGIFFVSRVYYTLTDDFRIGGITESLPIHPEWAECTERTVSPSIFEQSYRYLGKGAQCYAFASEDGEYIIKFFKFKHLRPHWYMRLLPDWKWLRCVKEQDWQQKQQKRDYLFRGYSLALREHPNHAQVVYLHLQQTHNFQKTLVVYDKLGLRREIDIDATPFIVQRKGRTLRQVIREKLEKAQITEAKEALSAIIAMYLEEYRSGMYDRDHGIMHNTGFVGEKPFHLDLGKFCRHDAMSHVETYGPDLSFVLWKIDTWLQQNFPEERNTLKEHMAAVFAKETGLLLDLEHIDPTQFQRKRLWQW